MQVRFSVLRRRIERFEEAVANKAFEGSIPVFSNDREEQADLDAAHLKINRDYRRTLNNLLKITSVLPPEDTTNSRPKKSA